jgi:hypothetical protein
MNPAQNFHSLLNKELSASPHRQQKSGVLFSTPLFETENLI